MAEMKQGLSLEWLRDLPVNWDTYGARRISEAAIATARYLSVVPVADGGVQIELYAGGMEIEIEIRADGRIGSVLASPAPVSSEGTER